MTTYPGDLPETAKCTRCKERATIRLPQHHAIFCGGCFIHFFETAALRAMKKFALPASTPLMVAVSGGKDSLALWDVLHRLGYDTKGLHIDLGIDGFSEASAAAVDRFAKQRGLSWVRRSLKEEFGHTVPEIRKRTRRKICSVCGLLKRQLLNRLTIREGFRALVVGHNLDDEAGRLLGNIVRRRTQYFDKQYPFLPSPHPKMPAKLKPLYRLESQEIKIYCSLSEIQPIEQKCPLSRGATSHFFKEALDFLESRMPGTKRDFLFSYIESRERPSAESDFGTCRQCSEPAYADLCSVCNLANRLREGDG